MNSRATSDLDAQRRRRQLTNAIKGSLRELRIQLTHLNHNVGVRLDLKDVDLDCLDVIARDGPLSPSALARRTGLHPATITGILDRLERAGWVTRERGPTDRRAVSVHASRQRAAEVYRLYAGMSTSMDQLCADYTTDQLELLADFLRRTTDAGRHATAELAGD